MFIFAARSSMPLVVSCPWRRLSLSSIMALIFARSRDHSSSPSCAIYAGDPVPQPAPPPWPYGHFDPSSSYRPRHRPHRPDRAHRPRHRSHRSSDRHRPAVPSYAAIVARSTRPAPHLGRTWTWRWVRRKGERKREKKGKGKRERGRRWSPI